ncbi:TIGR04165 family Cys-rich peptide [Methanobacterium sp. ACI-7]|uniref:TIGR04165 family Cys-rich peptide n=1 Tax=unclassified Methanobacterium TaxID=2627676 RepID=UPI0039C17E4D
MKLGKLDQECPKCGCKDKTIKRDIEQEHRAQATTGAVVCSECGHVFKSKEDDECEEDE